MVLEIVSILFMAFMFFTGMWVRGLDPRLIPVEKAKEICEEAINKPEVNEDTIFMKKRVSSVKDTYPKGNSDKPSTRIMTEGAEWILDLPLTPDINPGDEIVMTLHRKKRKVI